MLYNLFELTHDTLGMCFYTLPAMVLGVITLVIALGHNRNHKKREDEFKKNLEEKISNEQISGEA